MSRFPLPFVVFVLLAVLGCTRKEPEPVAEAHVDPAPVITPQPAPPDDGSIPPPRLVPVRSRMQSLTLGVDYLLTQQTKDGAWHSDVYATFKDGTALTPLAVTALQEAYEAGVRTPAIEAAIKNGCEFLAQFAKLNGTITPSTDGFDYPIYTAALTLKAFMHPTAKDYAKYREAWVKYIKERQLTEKLGWKPEEKQYGGWGYCRVIPKKPEPGAFAPPLIESNLSATLFALDALRAAGETDAEVYKKAAGFVLRCQNDDGGFHFIYDDPVRNKAGVATNDPPSFHSYGSTSADGFRALRLCLLPEHEKREQAAADWLKKNFRADHHPGTYVKAHEPNRDAVYYYYAASVAKAFRDHKTGGGPGEPARGSTEKATLPNGRDWAADLSYQLAIRQAKDGSWTNPVELVRENEPLVASSNAILALARCSSK